MLLYIKDGRIIPKKTLKSDAQTYHTFKTNFEETADAELGDCLEFPFDPFSIKTSATDSACLF
jgi:hypothetical protein